MCDTITTSVDIYVPIRVSPLLMGVSLEKKIYQSLEEIEGMSGNFKFRNFEGKEYIHRFNLKKPPNRFTECDQVDLPFENIFQYAFLQASVEGAHERREMLDQDGKRVEKLSTEELIKISKEHFANDVLKSYFDIVLASNISRPGVLNPDGGAIFIDGTKYKNVDLMFSPIADALDIVQDFGWPILEDLSLITVWEWLNRIPNFEIGIGTNPAGRALAAFSYLFGSSFDSEGPFMHGIWAIIGLEALYGEGNIGMLSQLIEKTEAFLGERKTHKQLVADAYNFRSRFIHGNINFPYRHCRTDALPEHDKFYKNAFKPEYMNIAMLVATLQKMAKLDLQQLKFRVVMV